MSTVLPQPNEDRRRIQPCTDCGLIRSIDPEIGLCPDCYQQYIEEEEV